MRRTSTRRFSPALEKHGQQIVFQFSLGAEPLPFETASRLSQRTIGQLAEMIARHPGLRFQCFLASRHANQSLCTLARELPNFSLAGYWWHNFFPDAIRQVMDERLDMLPVNKQVGFFSDAYCVEWVYGKVLLVRKQLARVLAEKIEQKQYTPRRRLGNCQSHYVRVAAESFGHEALEEVSRSLRIRFLRVCLDDVGRRDQRRAWPRRPACSFQPIAAPPCATAGLSSSVFQGLRVFTAGQAGSGAHFNGLLAVAGRYFFAGPFATTAAFSLAFSSSNAWTFASRSFCACSALSAAAFAASRSL